MNTVEWDSIASYLIVCHRIEWNDMWSDFIVWNGIGFYLRCLVGGVSEKDLVSLMSLILYRIVQYLIKSNFVL